MTQRENRSEPDRDSSKTPTADALEDLRGRIFGANPGRGAIQKASEDAGAEAGLVRRGIQPSTIDALRKVEKEVREKRGA